MMEKYSYNTIAESAEGQVKIKGSRFMAFAFPVGNEEEIKMYLDSLRKKYHDARHHCYAWRLGSDYDHYRFNDDGEPSNSAGKPILGQIQAKDLTNVLVVVVRYYGGTLLGVGGLIQAYKSAAFAALESAPIIEQFVMLVYEVKFLYPDMNLVMKVLKELEAEQWDQKFEIECSMKIKVKKGEGTRLQNLFLPFNNIKIKLLYEE